MGGKQPFMMSVYIFQQLVRNYMTDGLMYEIQTYIIKLITQPSDHDPIVG